MSAGSDSTVDYSGVLAEVVDGSWIEPETGKQYDIPIRSIAIRGSLDGIEADLIKPLHDGQKLTVVSDPYTYEAMGKRVAKALRSAGMSIDEFVWQKPVCSDQGVEEVRAATRHSDAMIAVGSGTVSDSVKYASFLDGRRYSVFATSPMNAFTTATASVSFDGFKRSLTCHGADGVFFDLSTLAACPPRLISAAFADVICRTTAQVDWLLSHKLFDTAYAETPYRLLAYDEADMIANAPRMLSGDLDALAMLTRISAIMGLGTNFTQTTHSGSMAEHMISHYIDMFAGELHPGTSHGEQVGVACLTMSLLQNQTMSRDTPPVLGPTSIPKAALRERCGSDVAANLIEQTELKAFDQASADAMNQRLETEWPELQRTLKSVMLPYEHVRSAMQAAGCQLTASDLELDADFYRETVSRARFIRDRFSMLDLVDDSTGLEAFVEQMPV